MRKVLRKILAGAAAATLLFAVAGKASAAPIPVSLILAIDASGSISNADYALQRTAYASVLNSSLITTDGKIAIGVVEFGLNVETVFNLTVIDSEATKASLVAAITAMNRTGINTGATSIGLAIQAALNMLQNGPDGTPDNWVIDVSTDGANNAGSIGPVLAVENANAADTVVNCLGVGPSANCGFMNAQDNLDLGGFSILAPNFAAFERALTLKIAQETGQPLPEPTLLTLAGLGLVGMLARRRTRA